MPKRQKPKVQSTSSPINKPVSARKIARTEAQNERAAFNESRRANGVPTRWETAKARRAHKRLAQNVRAKWRRENRSSIGEKPNVSNTSY